MKHFIHQRLLLRLLGTSGALIPFEMERVSLPPLLYVLHQEIETISLKGPYDLGSLEIAVKQQEILASDFVYLSNVDGHWERLFEVPELRSHVLHTPAKKDLDRFESLVASQLPKAAAASERGEPTRQSVIASQWFFRLERTEIGPFSMRQILPVIELRKLKGKVELRHRSKKSWFPSQSLASFLARYPELHEDQKTKFSIERSNNKRSSQRSTQLATVWGMIDRKIQLVGVCINISDTGMQIVHSPGLLLKSGQNVRLLVDPNVIESFWATAVVARTAAVENKVAFYFDSADELTALRQWLSKIQKHLL